MTTAELLKQRESLQDTGENDRTHEGAESGHEPLFAQDESDRFRNDWKRIQADFVDEPRRAVEQADSLVASAIQRLAQVFAAEKSRMERDWSQGQDVSTEDLRQALRRYRSFFDRLLNV